MLKHIEEFDKYVFITGFRNIRIKDTEELLRKVQSKKPPNTEVQLFDAKYVASWQHLHFAGLNALTTFKNMRNISKSIAMETMLYASAQRQIRKAMGNLGIRPETSEIAVLIIGETTKAVKSALQTVSACLHAQQDGTVLELSERKRKVIQKAFGISDLELKTVMKKDNLEDALINLVVERMALLTTER